ncbi:MAG: hypothetical protein HC837_17315, partial [Chloroflexaceae bacterium]|nr:hypothetical protein [Chloroflexaceae bacterium]
MSTSNRVKQPAFIESPQGHAVSAALLLLSVVLLTISRLANLSPWWDEGWTLAVAQTWVDHGHYGMLRNGEPVSPGLSAAFPTVAPVAIGFRLFGVGIWQGRLPILVITLAAFALFYHLAEILYRPRVGLLAVFLALFVVTHPDFHAVITGQQVLAEMPMIALLLAGLVWFFYALQQSPWSLILAIAFWSLALVTKAQVLPFWAVSLLWVLIVLLFQRQWRFALLTAGALVGSYAMAGWGWNPLIGRLLEGQTVGGAGVQGLYSVTAFVPVTTVRQGA